MAAIRGNLDAVRRTDIPQQETKPSAVGRREYGTPAEPAKASSFDDEIALKGLVKEDAAPLSSKKVMAHLKTLIAAKGREYCRRLTPEAGKAVEEAVSTSVQSRMITEEEGEGMRFALAQEMIRRGFGAG